MKQTTFPSYGIFCFYPFDCERLANLVDRCDDFFPRSQHHWRRRNSSNSLPWLNHDLRGVSGMKCESMELSLKLKTNQHGVLLIKRIVSQHGSTSMFSRDAGRSEKFRSSTFPQPKHRNGLKIRYD
jgi:hypothetical protein